MIPTNQPNNQLFHESNLPIINKAFNNQTNFGPYELPKQVYLLSVVFYIYITVNKHFVTQLGPTTNNNGSLVGHYYSLTLL